MSATANRPPKPVVPQREDDPRPHRLKALWGTTIGKKYVAAVSGAVLVVFVVVHMLGNLKAIEGPGKAGGHAAIDQYGNLLRRLGSPAFPHNFALWLERITLIVALALHLTAITQLWLRNRRAKPPAYQTLKSRSTLSARTMKTSGVLILAFIVFHILHFTTRTIHPSKLVDGDIYANAYGSFHKWWVVVIYVGAVLLLGLHMNHALWSGAQSTGMDNPDRNWFWRRMATTVTALTVIGFAVIPLLYAFDALPKPKPVDTRSRIAHVAPGASSVRAAVTRRASQPLVRQP